MEAGGAPVIIIRDNHRLRPDPLCEPASAAHRKYRTARAGLGSRGTSFVLRELRHLQMIRQPECATVMEEKEREVIHSSVSSWRPTPPSGGCRRSLTEESKKLKLLAQVARRRLHAVELVLHNVDDFAHQTQSLSNNEVRHVIDKRRLLNLHLRLADSGKHR